MYEDLSKDEILKLISDYKTYRSLAESPLRNCSYHAFRKDLERTIKMCDENLIYLFTALKKYQGEEDES